MLAHLLEVDKRVFQPPAYRSHAAKGCALELLALEERLCVFEETNIVSRDGFNEMFSSRKLAKGYSEMVGIVERIQQVLVERMYVLKTGKPIYCELASIQQSKLQSTQRTENQRQLLSEGLLGIFDLACIKVSYPGNLETTADLSRQASLRAAQDHI